MKFNIVLAVIALCVTMGFFCIGYQLTYDMEWHVQKTALIN